MVDFEERVEVYLHNFGCFSSEEFVSRLEFIKIWPLILEMLVLVSRICFTFTLELEGRRTCTCCLLTHCHLKREMIRCHIPKPANGGRPFT